MTFTRHFTATPADIDELGHVNTAVWVRRIQDMAMAHWQAVGPAHALAEGAFLIMVPWIGRNSRPTRVKISLHRAALYAIDVAAAMRWLTRSAFLAEAARNEIESHC